MKTIINFLDNTPNQPSKFRAKNWVEINDKSRGTYDICSQIGSILCDCSDANILAKGTVTAPSTAFASVAANKYQEKCNI